MRKSKKLATILISAILAIGIVGCGTSNNNGSGEPGTSNELKVLRFAAQDPQVPLDPQKHTYSHLLKISDQVLESLLGTDTDGNLIPVLLTNMPELSENKLTYSFELKDNIKFHNGELLKSSDVKYSYERVLKEGKMSNLIDMVQGADKVMKKEADSLEGFKIIDDTHFDITLTEQYIPFLSAIATPYIAIYPEQACSESGQDWGIKALIGTGPFKLKEYVQGTGVTVLKNEEYHGNPVKLDEINFKFIQDSNTQVMEYQKGNIDVLQLDSALYPTYSNDEKIKKDMYSFNPIGLVFLTINNKEITDPKIREALSYSIDRKEICESLLYGTATPAKTFLPKGLLGYNDSVEEYEYNPEKAKQILADAGYPNGIELEAVDNTKYPTLSKIIIAIQDQAKASGINIKINQIDNAAWADMKRSGKLKDMAISNWYVDYIDPDGMIYQTMSEKLTQQNSNFYADKEFNDLLNTARITEDPAQREEMYKKADELLTRRDYGAIPIYNETMYYLKKDYVKNFEVSSTYRFLFGDTDIQK